MTYQYLLDTNIISDLVRNPQGLVFQRIATVGENCICTSIVVACELRFGAAKSSSPRLAQQLEQILNLLPILPLDTPVDFHACDNSHALRASRNTHRSERSIDCCPCPISRSNTCDGKCS